MRYRWTEKDLLSARDKLIKILQNEKDYQRQCYYLKVLDAINNLDKVNISIHRKILWRSY